MKIEYVFFLLAVLLLSEASGGIPQWGDLELLYPFRFEPDVYMTLIPADFNNDGLQDVLVTRNRFQTTDESTSRYS